MGEFRDQCVIFTKINTDTCFYGLNMNLTDLYSIIRRKINANATY